MVLLFLLITIFSFNISASEALISNAVKDLRFSEVLKLKENKLDISKVNMDETIEKLKKNIKPYNFIYSKNDINPDNEKIILASVCFSILSSLQIGIIAIGIWGWNYLDIKDRCLLPLEFIFFSPMTFGCVSLIKDGIKGKSFSNQLKYAYAIKKLSKIS